MIRPTTRQLWLLLAAGCLGLVLGSIALTAWLDLHPCHLCIFQRLLFMGLAVFGLLAGLLGCRPVARAAGLFVALIAASGVAVAGYQSWLQEQPAGSTSCVAGEPTLVEQFVEWLGRLQPALPRRTRRRSCRWPSFRPRIERRRGSPQAQAFMESKKSLLPLV